MAHVIKRYSNRKLYDVQKSRYVTLDDLAEMIRAGRDVAVVDADTGKDLTPMILTEILLERARNRQGNLPSAFLSQLIRHGDAWNEYVQKTLRASMGALMTSQREFERFFQTWADQAGLATPEEIKNQKPRKRKARGSKTAPRTSRR